MRTRYIFSIIVVSVIVVFSCKKEPETPTGNKIEIGQTVIDTISYFEAEVISEMENTGGNEITQHGHCWSMEKDPTTDNTKTQLGELNEPKTFTSQLTELNDNTKYFVRYYITYQQGTVYGEEESIQTLKTGIPVVVSTVVSNITITSAYFNSEIISDSGLNVTIRGFCWDTTNVFTVSDCLDTTIVGLGLGVFNSEVSSLDEGVNYYVKAYAINENGMSYGEVEEFQTVPVTLAEVSTSTLTNILATIATSGGIVISEGNGTVTVRGICWSTYDNPTLENNIGFTSNGNGLGDFISNVNGLTDNTSYYVSAYATNEKGTTYGEPKEFTTLELTLSEVNTTEITNITVNSARSGGNVTSNGNGIVSQRGVCWNTTGNPTLENSLGNTTDGSGIGNYMSIISNLSDGITYYLSAYATNEKGTSYGEIIQFATLIINTPAVNTTQITNITSTTATTGGNVTDDGNGTVTARGVCWNTTGNPTLENSIGQTTNGVGAGSFISDINYLSSEITYHATAYATNEKGTSYGEVLSFETLDMTPCDGQTFFTYEGQTYNTVEIQYQCWMKENLNHETGNSWCYDDDPANCATYGRLYEWETIMNGETSSNTIPSGVQGICPDGWHLPSDEEWKILEGNVDTQYEVGDIEWNKTEYRGYDVGKRLKTTSEWQHNTGTNAVGFSALPGGWHRADGFFSNLPSYGYWWSATASGSTYAWFRDMKSNSDKMGRNVTINDYAFSVRCVRD